MLSYLRKVMRDTKDRGASAIEYGLMVAAIAAIIVGVVFGLGGVVQEVFTTACTKIHDGTQTGADCQTVGNNPGGGNPGGGGQ